MQTIVSLVSAGIGVALVPESVGTFRREHLTFRRLGGSSATLRLALAHRAGTPSPLVQQFLATALPA